MEYKQEEAICKNELSFGKTPSIKQEDTSPVVKVESLNEQPEESVTDRTEAEKGKSLQVSCPHKDKPYYAKGMCRNCYHSKGRQKQAMLCQHSQRKHYAKGMCKACYLKIYKAKNNPDYKPRQKVTIYDSSTANETQVSDIEFSKEELSVMNVKGNKKQPAVTDAKQDSQFDFLFGGNQNNTGNDLHFIPEDLIQNVLAQSL